MASPRENFLRSVFARLNAEGVPCAVSRNAEEIFASTTSDIDLVVPPGMMAMVERAVTMDAEAHGFRLISRIEFTNLCLVYWSSGAEFVRIDLDGELRWHCFEVADAAALLEGASRRDGVAVISPRSEWFVLADRLAWQGSLPPRYRSRVEELLRDGQDESDRQRVLLRGFLERGDARGLRRHLILRSLLTPRGCLRMIRHGLHDAGRMVRRFFSPPGVLLRVTGDCTSMDWNAWFRTMSMAYPEAKGVRLGALPLRGLAGLFRGGLVVTERGHSLAARVCGLFASRRRCFRVVDAPAAGPDDLVVPSTPDRLVAFADALAAAILARR